MRTVIQSGLMVFILGATILAGCIYIPLPEHEPLRSAGVNTRKVNPETLGGLQPGHSTRADILLLLGKPDRRHEADRFFFYKWSAVTGEIIGYYIAADVLTDFAYGFEFSEDGVLKRHGQIGGRFKGKIDSQIRQWMHGDDQ